MSSLQLNFDAIINPDIFDSDQIEELKIIYEHSNPRLFLFLSNHPEIGSDCLWEISQFISGNKNSNSVITGVIIQVLGMYTDHIREKDLPCCFERIRFGLKAIERRLEYPYITYLMCTPTIHKKNIKDVYNCFANNVTLTRITECIPMHSAYNSDQITQLCNSLIDIQQGAYSNSFLIAIKSPMNSAQDMLIIRREAKKIAKSLRIINRTTKSDIWMIIDHNDIP